MAEVRWRNEQERRVTETAVRLVLTLTSGALSVMEILSAVNKREPSLLLTKGHINSVLYSMRARYLVRQTNKGENPPIWELACRQDGRLLIREVRRGLFWAPEGIELLVDEAPVEVQMKSSHLRGQNLECRPHESEAVVDWLRSLGIEVQLLAAAAATLPVPGTADFGRYFLVADRVRWQYYDPVDLRWRYPWRLRVEEGKRIVLRQGWAVRQQIGEGEFAYYRAIPGEFEAVENEDQAILSVMSGVERPPLPHMVQGDLALIALGERWLAPAYFQLLARFRPAEKVVDRHFYLHRKDLDLVIELLGQLGIQLGPWSADQVAVESLAPLLSDEDQERFCRFLERFIDLTRAEGDGLWQEEAPNFVGSPVVDWVTEGLLASVAIGPAGPTALVVAVDWAERYRKSTLRASRQRLLLWLPERNQVVTVLVRKTKLRPGEWVRLEGGLLFTGLGLFTGSLKTAKRIDGIKLALQRSDFGTERDRYRAGILTDVQFDWGSPFPRTGRPCRIAIIRGMVREGIDRHGCYPSILAVDERGAESALAIPWALYVDGNHAVHHVNPGELVELVVQMAPGTPVGQGCWLLDLHRIKAEGGSPFDSE